MSNGQNGAVEQETLFAFDDVSGGISLAVQPDGGMISLQNYDIDGDATDELLLTASEAIDLGRFLLRKGEELLG